MVQRLAARWKSRRPADDGGARFWLTIKFPNGEELDVRVARTQLLQELLDIEADES